ncbi:MAG TPA: SPOR domain-containing protein [Bryobacteraceae bacterium]|nr:SPOR domain-containing protein [Bryobacteraceae bacterium]
MASNSENESEILLGNKQLLAIFFVIAILLGIAFTGGYMLGRNSPEKKPLVIASATNDTAAGAQPKDSGLETHPVGPPASAASDESTGDAKSDSPAAAKRNAETASPDEETQDPTPLGTPKQKTSAKAVKQQPETPAVSNVSETYAPQTGQMFLQVTALARDDAYGVAEVLAKKGFRAHAVPKPGKGKLYRVLVGPIRDTSDLSSTRDALRKTGFQDVILQRY